MKIKILIGLLMLIVGLLAGVVLQPYLLKDQDDKPVAKSDAKPAAMVAATQTPHSDGVSNPDVVLTAESMRSAGIKLEALQTANREETQPAFAEVLDISSLLSDVTRYNQLGTDIAKGEVAIRQATQNAARNTLLNQDDHNVSDQVLQSAQADLATAKAAQAGSISERANVLNQLRMNWGNALIAPSGMNQVLVSKLLSHQASLWRVSLPAGRVVAQLPSRIEVDTPTGKQWLQVLGKAVHADESLQGVSVLAISDQPYPVVLRVTAHWSQGVSTAGLVVPEAAIIWWQGAPWVYAQVAPLHFKRVAMMAAEETPQGWFAKDSLPAGAQVVVQGAQLLLSKEQRDAMPVGAAPQGDGDD